VYDVDLVRSYTLGNPVVAEKESDLLPPIHFGDILFQDFTRPHLMGMNELALAMRLPPAQIGAVIHGKRGITADAAFGIGLRYHRRTVAELAAGLRFAGCRNRQTRRNRLGRRANQQMTKSAVIIT
jgi:antitoxin HigA-1